MTPLRARIRCNLPSRHIATPATPPCGLRTSDTMGELSHIGTPRSRKLSSALATNALPAPISVPRENLVRSIA
ncbi:Uncharacterised protein [Bordetella pertussis]|nr:Uncharacterised protein [Bordetella pertussis]